MEEKNVFGMIEDVSEGQADILNEITGVKDQVSVTGSKIEELQKEIKDLKQLAAQRNQQRIQPQPQISQQEAFNIYLNKAKKSWRWFGSLKQFEKQKSIAMVSLYLLLVVGIVSSIVTTICFNMYSTFTLFENIWLICAVFYLIYTHKAELKYDVNDMAAHTSKKYSKEEFGILYPDKEKLVFTIFMWLGFIATIGNIICFWTDLGINARVFATIFEVLFFATMVFSKIMYLIFFSGYSIIWLDGNNIFTGEKVVTVLPPGSKGLLTEEEFRTKAPFLFD